MTKFFINTDGGSRNNPGPAASGFIIRNKEKEVVAKDGIYLGVATNNQAEYMAVKFSLEKLLNDFYTQLPANVEVKADSLLIVSQLNGKYKIKNPDLKKIFTEIKNLEKSIGIVSYSYIPREENSAADELVNEALDKQLL